MPAAEPDVVVARHVIDEPLERAEAAGTTDEPRVETDRHQLRSPLSFRVQHVEGVAGVLEEGRAPVEPRRRGEPVVVDVRGVRDQQQRPARLDHPVRELVGVGVLAVDEAALLGDQANRVLAAPAQEVPQRARAGNPLVDLDHLADVLALGLLRHAEVVDPAIAVARDVPVRLDHRGDRVGVALERHGDGEDGDGDAASGEEAVEAPEADPASVLVHRLDGQVAMADLRRHEAELGQEGLGRRRRRGGSSSPPPPRS